MLMCVFRSTPNEVTKKLEDLRHRIL